jgi:hypothetical protein
MQRDTIILLYFVRVVLINNYHENNFMYQVITYVVKGGQHLRRFSSFILKGSEDSMICCSISVIYDICW